MIVQSGHHIQELERSMRNKNKKWNREDWISVVITLVFVLGFLVLANSGTEITGLTAIELPTTIEFEVNSVIPSTAILEISSGTQVQQMNLSEFTVKLSELQNIQPVLEDGKLVAYNITNMTIDLSKYDIEPTETVNLRFLEVYKEITRETVTKKITKEEIITEEIVSVTKEPEFAIQPAENLTEEPTYKTEEIEFRTQEDIFTEIWDDGSDDGWTDLTGFYAPSTDQAKSGSYSENFAGNTDGSRALLTTTTEINLEGKTNGNASAYMYMLTAMDAGEECCIDLYDHPNSKWILGVIGTSDCANGQGGNGANEGKWISISRELNATYYNTNFSMRFSCDSSATQEQVFIDDIVVSADAPDSTAPTVDLVWPANTTNSTIRFINFTYNATDAGTVDDCSLWLSKSPGVWELNYTDTAIEEAVNQTFNITIEDSSILWRVECNDTVTNNRGNSTTYNISIDNNDPPIVNINFPKNNTYSLSHSVNFTYNVTDIDKFGTSGNVVNCTLLYQKGGSWIYDESNASAITETINQTINITLEHTNINWTIECIDALGAKANASEGYFNYTVLNSTVTTTEVFPKNNTYSLSHSVNFTYNVTSLDTISSCSLWLQKGTWELNKTDTGIEKNVNQTMNLTLGHETVNWTISCNNTFNEPDNSSIMNFSVYDATPTVTLVWPGNNTYSQSTKNVNLTYNITSPDSAITCDLYINEAWNSTDTSIERSINQTFNLTFASYQNINWSIGCNNSFNEYVNSTTYNYSMFEVTNQAPVIQAVNISVQENIDVSAGTYKLLNFTFVVCDPDEENANLIAYGNYTGENSLFDDNLSCTKTTWSNTTCQQFNCTFNLWSWYKAGSWNFSMNATDGSDWVHNNGTTWTLGTTTAITIHPANISWSNLIRDSWNNTADGDPVVVNNTGNADIASGKVNITGYALMGETTKTDYIPGGNFSVGIATGSKEECTGYNTATTIVNATSTNIASSILARGNFTANDGSTGQEQLYFCLAHVPPASLISAQSYSTDAYTPAIQWVIGVS